MRAKIWRMCVVGLMLAAPIVCTATTIPEALADAGGGRYVRMDPGSWITLTFGTACSGTGPAVVLMLAQDCTGIRVEFYRNNVQLYDYATYPYDGGVFQEGSLLYGPGQNSPYDALRVVWGTVPFDSVKITACGVAPVYLDAVQGIVADGGQSVFGVPTDYDGVITPFPQVTTVTIDIKPGNADNVVNLGSQGVVPVAILSTSTFDATQVNPATVTLSGASIALRGNGKSYLTQAKDVNNDGLVDLVLDVETENFDPNVEQSGIAVLTGSTYAGQAIEGSDHITVVPPK